MRKVSFMFFASVLIACTTNAQLVVFEDNYAPGVSFVPFGGSVNTLSIDMAVKYSGTASLKIPVTSGYTGGALVSAAPSDLSAYNAITFWAKNDMPYLLDGVGIGNNSTTTVYACERNGINVTSTWTKFFIPIPVAAKLTAESGLFHFAEGSGEGSYNIWIDEIKYENVTGGIIGTPTASFATETIAKNVGDNFNANGTTSTYPVNSVNQSMQTARAYFTWSSSNMSVATVNAMGVGTALAAGTTNVTAMLGSVAAGGTLTVNVTAAPSGPATAAPTPPARSAADVISIFSGAYTDLGGTDFFPNWGQNTVVTEVNIAGNPTKKYTSLNYQGVQFASSINASAFGKLHLDIWTPDCTAFEVFLISPGNERGVVVTPTIGGWKSVDIDVNSTNYPTVNLSDIIQFKFVGTPGSGSTVYLDNIYFYKSGPPPAMAPTVAAPTPTRTSNGVISLFSNAYTNVPVDTWLTGWSPGATVLTDTLIAGNSTKRYTNVSFLGVEFTAPTVNATNMDFMHIDIWTPNASVFKLKLVDFGANGIYDGGGDDREHEVTYNNPIQGSWISYDIPFTSFTGLTTRGHLAQMILSGSGSTLFIDNVYFYNSVLPITLTSFKVVPKNNTASLQWVTGTEQNNKGFAIERSLDGINWKQINFINGTNARNGSAYGAIDLTPAKGINYYRLKQIDFDGHATYYAIQSLSFDDANLAKFALYPNPATDNLVISLGAIENSRSMYSIIAADGRIVQNGTFTKSQANTVQTLDICKLPAGLYIIKLNDGSKQQSAKLKID